MKVSKAAIEIHKALMFLENTASATCGIIKNVCCENSDFIKISKNEGFDNIGNIANHCKLRFPVMFASITLKYTNQTVYSATCPFSLYTRHELDIQRTFRRSRGRLLSALCTFNLHPLSSGSMALSTSH